MKKTRAKLLSHRPDHEIIRISQQIEIIRKKTPIRITLLRIGQKSNIL